MEKLNRPALTTQTSGIISRMPKVLVANRGEIAIRILRSARELGWDTVAVYSEDDASHAGFADEAVKLNSVSDFMNVESIVNAAIQTQSTHLHPGYGFLSENPALPIALSQATNGRPLSLGLTAIFVSPRIESYARFNGGLFILDLNKAPWGCGTWPAFWTVGNDWPWNGEIDVIEGVHDNQHNQVAWHTAPGCQLDPSANFTGNIADGGGYQHRDCNSFINHNAGCGATEWSRASYGLLFDEQGGGVFVMKWDENSIAVWSFFRAAVPKDIGEGTPNPSEWGLPSAVLSSSMCDIPRFFKNHAIIFGV
ncbi:unnamed protein product [Cyclocybe aegerita]|uniref:Uncharacterized protein n=1 Tax=Cyclocybe aegerita TaxID=1973307 RepID=A0A8S0XYE0_CYCAE|nr:unnamed protein product [Cyclocybe aegerita]